MDLIITDFTSLPQESDRRSHIVLHSPTAAKAAQPEPQSALDPGSTTTTTAEMSSLHQYKKIRVPLAYPPVAIKEQSKTFIYPPLMSPSDEFFSSHQSAATSPTNQAPPPQPINIPQSEGQRQLRERRRNSMPVKPVSTKNPFKPGSMPTTTTDIPPLDLDSNMPPSPPTSPWKRSIAFTRPLRSTTFILDETPHPELPTDVRSWTSSHVAEYLAYSLRLYPRAITEDLGRYVRQSANLNGSQFIDLQEEDLERMQINLKWRTMILKAVGMLRRETLRIEELSWEDGYDAKKDGPMPASPVSTAGDPSLSPEIHPLPSRTFDSDIAKPQTPRFSSSDSMTDSIETSPSTPRDLGRLELLDPQELRRGIVEDITSVLLSWKKDQEEKTKKAQSGPIGGLGFMEGVVIGGLIVAFMMRFSR